MILKTTELIAFSRYIDINKINKRSSFNFKNFNFKLILIPFFNLSKSKLPFAIVGSNTIIEADGKSFRGRKYPWGIVNGKKIFNLSY